jgi:RimJ/RimL family protein N-acetyltransferase
MEYRCLKKQIYQEGEWSIVPIREIDMAKIRDWRNEQIIILRQNHILSEEEQKNYWERVLKPGFSEEKPHQILFSYLKNGELIGYGGLTHIDWNSARAEVSFLLATDRKTQQATYQKEFALFLSLLKRAAFEDLKLHRLFAETFNLRPAHVEVLEKAGFALEGTLKDHVRIENNYYDSLIHGLLNR